MAIFSAPLGEGFVPLALIERVAEGAGREHAGPGIAGFAILRKEVINSVLRFRF